MRITIIDEDKGKVILDEKCKSIMGVTHDGEEGGTSFSITNTTTPTLASMILNLRDLIGRTLKECREAAALLLAGELLKDFKRGEENE